MCNTVGVWLSSEYDVILINVAGRSIQGFLKLVQQLSKMFTSFSQKHLQLSSQ